MTSFALIKEMNHAEHATSSNDNHAKENTIIKPSEGTLRVVLDTDFAVTLDEELAEDQELEDSYVFVDADYHSYTEVESFVAKGSSSDCELSEREEEEDSDSKSKADKMEEQNGGVRKGCVKKVTKKTSNVEGSSGKDGGEDVSDSVNDDFTQLVNGNKVIALPNDALQRHPEDSYLFVRTETAKSIENKSVEDLIAYYAKILAIETISNPHPSLKSDAIIEGLDTLRICSEIFSSNPTEPSFVAQYMHTLEPQHQLSLSIALSIMLDTDDWIKLESEAVRNEEFEISVVIWALETGPRDLMLQRVEGKSEMQILLAVEEAWIAVHENLGGYEEKKLDLRRVAAEVIMWGKGAAWMFAK
ncbi:hypothetical protein J4E91_009712 [Alternaria rosae]|nr:hypothetical protein J4E91_009712 [Alternaria rosae]